MEFTRKEKKYKKIIRSGRGKDVIKALIDLGILYYDNSLYDQALEYLLKAYIKNEIKNIRSRYSKLCRYIGFTYLRLADIKKSEIFLIEALECTPERNKKIISEIYDALGDVYTKGSEPLKGFDLYKKAAEIRERSGSKRELSETLNKIGVNYYFRNDYDSALTYLKRSLLIKKGIGENDHFIALTENNLCLTYFKQGQYTAALKYGLKALKTFENFNSDVNKAKVLNNIGLIYFEMSMFPDALNYQFRSLEIKEKFDGKQSIANTLSNIGMVLSRLFNLDKALDYSQRALVIRKEINDQKGLASSYNEIGRIYDKMNEFDKAEDFFKRAIEIKEKLQMPWGTALSYENLGMTFFKKGDIERAEKYLFKSKKLYETTGERKAVAGIYRNLSSLFIAQDKFHEALVYIKRSHEIAKELKLIDKMRDSYKILSEIYKKRNRFKKSLHYFTKYSEIKESINDIQKSYEINNISTKYENEKREKEKEIYRLKNVELVKINKELRKSQKELQISNYSKDKFFNIIAHDLKNPFSILYTTSELLSTFFDELNEKKKREYIQTINISTKHLLKLLENLLEWSRTQSGKKQINISNFNLLESLEQCLLIIKPAADNKEIKLINKVDKNIDIEADKNMIKTIMRNLIMNAVKFTDKGGKVEIISEKNDKEIKVSVIDTGTGIKNKDIKKLFHIDEHFVTNGTSNEKGTGLGLILCKEFIEKHNGRICVESTYRKGSCFSFTIPV